MQLVNLKVDVMGASRGPFEPEYSELPGQIPVFPLSGALLLPGGRLPLNIFEPRYLSMVRDVMAQPHRLIGMIQSRDDSEDDKLFEIFNALGHTHAAVVSARRKLSTYLFS